MKKTSYTVLAGLAFSIVLLSSCKKYNDQFDGLDAKTIPTNVASYVYTLVDADYTTIATETKKPVTDQITLLNTKLKTASSADSVTILAQIAALNLTLVTDSLYIKATYLGANKFFNSKMQAKDYVPYLLNKNYIFADKGSTMSATYNVVDMGDTLAIPAASRFTLTTADYALMGTSAGLPGQYNNMSASMPVLKYLDGFLKLKCPYAVTGNVKVVSYLYYDTKSTKKQYRILTFNGLNWASTANQYINIDPTWLYDPTIKIPLVRVSPNNPYIMTFIDYVRVNMPDKFYQKGTYINEEHYFGFSAYYAEIIMTTDRTTYGDDSIKAITTDAEKYIFFKQRVTQAMPLFTQLNFPLLQTDVSGIQQYVVWTIMTYYSSSKQGLYTIKMKCIKSGTTSSPAEYAVESIVETF
ncbi:MAG: hypothetical protein Q7U54_20375 [Bacteroidales bacterium]|nr:hypothetical protein [Bacteroidales bacterium]